MTEIPPSESSSSPIEAAADAASVEDDLGPRTFKLALKGCGCLVALSALGFGVAMAGGGATESWGSALVGVLFLLMIVGSSGLIGWHKH